MELLKKSEEKIENLVEENQGLKKQLEDRAQQDQIESLETKTSDKSGSNDEEEDIGNAGDTPKDLSAITTSKRTHEMEENEDVVMKRDRLQVENVALKQKIRLLVEEEKYMLQKLEARTAKLHEARSKVLAMKKEKNKEFEEMSRTNLDIEGERDELQWKLLLAERRIEVLESSLEKALLKLKEKDDTVQEKSVLNVQNKINMNFKQSLEKTRKDTEEELKKAILKVKQHVAYSNKQRDTDSPTSFSIKHSAGININNSVDSKPQTNIFFAVRDAIDATHRQHSGHAVGDINVQEAGAGGDATAEDDQYVVEEFDDNDNENEFGDDDIDVEVMNNGASSCDHNEGDSEVAGSGEKCLDNLGDDYAIENKNDFSNSNSAESADADTGNGN